MLNVISNLEAAADARAGFGRGALLPEGVRTVEPNGTCAVAFPRTRAVWLADVCGPRHMAASQGTMARQGQPSGLQNPSEKYAHTTRIAAASGGASGPHPARDPV